MSALRPAGSLGNERTRGLEVPQASMAGKRFHERRAPQTDEFHFGDRCNDYGRRRVDYL
jgi:hypothetical protein